MTHSNSNRHARANRGGYHHHRDDNDRGRSRQSRHDNHHLGNQHRSSRSRSQSRELRPREEPFERQLLEHDGWLQRREESLTRRIRDHLGYFRRRADSLERQRHENEDYLQRRLREHDDDLHELRLRREQSCERRRHDENHHGNGEGWLPEASTALDVRGRDTGAPNAAAAPGNAAPPPGGVSDRVTWSIPRHIPGLVDDGIHVDTVPGSPAEAFLYDALKALKPRYFDRSYLVVRPGSAADTSRAQAHPLAGEETILARIPRPQPPAGHGSPRRE